MTAPVPSFARARVGVGVLLLAAVAIALAVLWPRPPGLEGRVMLVALDGGALPLVRELAAAGRLPSFAKAIERGAIGPLASIYTELPFSRERGGGYWSPVVWTSVATGKEPAVHGVVDFLLPGTSGRLRSAGSDHRRVRALWNIAGDFERTVAVVGWRNSWPAERVGGYFVSDRLGLRFASRLERAPLQEARLTYPEQLAAGAGPLLERFREVDALADRTLLSVAPCALEARDAGVARVTYWGDWLRHRLALEYWDADASIDFLAVYYNGIDAFGHMFLPAREGAAGGCTIDPPLVDRYYALVDGYLGDWLERLDDETTLLVVTDHGMVASGAKGEHADNGFALLVGRGVRAGTRVAGADVLDVAPTVLYLLGLPLAADMKGAPFWEAIDRDHLASHPPRSVPTHESGAARTAPAEPSAEAEREAVERLRALGYLD